MYSQCFRQSQDQVDFAQPGALFPRTGEIGTESLWKEKIFFLLSSAVLYPPLGGKAARLLLIG